jgi:asparagine synthase (glutamine-hydrolysing)
MSDTLEAPSITNGVEHEFGFVPSFTFGGEHVGPGQLAKAVEGRSVSLDHAALNVFLRTDLFLNGATPFREVRRFCPPPVIVSEAAISRAEASEAYADLFRQAVARRIQPDATVALSGGRDSRHILFELHAQGHVPRCVVTVDLETSHEVAAAREVARAVGANHVVVPPNSSVDGAIYAVRATDFMSTQHAWLADLARQRDAHAWWDGIAGDVLSAGLFLDDWNVRLFHQRRLDELAEGLVRPGKVPYFRDQSLFPRADAVAAIFAELQRHVEAANPVGSFYFWTRTRVNIGASPFGMLRLAGQTALAPFLDRDLWRFLASLPMHIVGGQQFHIDVIKHCYPQFADLAYSAKRPASNSSYRRRAARLLGRLATRKPALENAGAAARSLRSLLIPSRASDMEWIFSTWAYGDTLTRMV